MRAGAFAEKRVIELLNLRFVPFFFNTGGPGLGKDRAAAAFVKGKVKNRWAFLAAFTPDGKYISESEIYAGKNAVFEYLVDLLKDFPECARLTPKEKKILKASGTPEKEKAAGRLLEQLGRYGEAKLRYAKARADLPLARIARFERDWKTAEKHLARLQTPDVPIERAYRLIAERKYKQTLTLLERAIQSHPKSKRLAEMRFYAGVACWFLRKRDRAYYHWCWVVENLPRDHMTRRCYIAAAAEGMPYKNPELGGFRSNDVGGMIEKIQAAYARAKKTYEKIKNREK